MDQTCRVFDRDSHEQFARLSCDYNPIHMDAAAARRMYAGAPIVHGIHSLMWLLECVALSCACLARAQSLKVQFVQPIYVGDTVAFELTESTPRLIRARLLVGPEEVLVATLGFEPASRPMPAGPASRGARMPPPRSPTELTLEQMTQLAGCLSFDPVITQIEAAFPQAVLALGMSRIAALVYCSCVVGMVVPGMHSLFSGLDVAFCNEMDEPADALRFSVESIVSRFRLVRVGVSSRSLRGSLETVSRMPPIRQAGMDQTLSIVSRNEFRNSRALVIGGSRGLGELTSKLIAAGGGDPIITYATGKAEAEAVARDIRDAGASCTLLPYDVRRPAAGQLAALCTQPTHLYYFATPPIFRRKAGLFDPLRFDEFNQFYITAFFDLVQACRSATHELRVFYPSSSALDLRPGNMTEYSMAKAAAEVLCADLAKFVPKVRVVAKRLPRLLTDQTNSVVQAKTPDALQVMLEIAREMHQ